MMGPRYASPDSTGSNMSPLPFRTGSTIKVQYHDSLHTLDEITRSYAELHNLEKARLEMLGLIVYLACDDRAKARLRAEETEKRMTFKGNVTGADGQLFVDQGISFMGHCTLSESSWREIKLFGNSHQCKRDPKKMAEAYEKRFEACVARYVHKKMVDSVHDDQQKVLILPLKQNLTHHPRHKGTF